MKIEGPNQLQQFWQILSKKKDCEWIKVIWLHLIYLPLTAWYVVSLYAKSHVYIRTAHTLMSWYTHRQFRCYKWRQKVKHFGFNQCLIMIIPDTFESHTVLVSWLSWHITNAPKGSKMCPSVCCPLLQTSSIQRLVPGHLQPVLLQLCLLLLLPQSQG